MGANGSSASAPAGERSPYIGLSYYTEADAEWFFGRGEECETIIANLRAARLTILYAPSGVGKSSLLRAGVARQCRELAEHQLAERGAAHYLPIVFGAWRDDPVEDLIAAIEAAVEPLLPAGGAVELPRDGLAEAIEAAAAAVDAELLIILDQFEEYFLYRGGEPAGRRFADELAACVNSPEVRANFLIAIREDAYAGLGELFAGKIANVYGNYLQLEYLDRDAGRETIVKPIEHFNEIHAGEQPVEIEPRLVDAVLDQVRTDEVSADGPVDAGDGAGRAREEIETPYLQLVMSNLWSHEREQNSRVLRFATLGELGGAREIMRAHLDRALGSLSPEERDVALDAFHYLVTPSGSKIAFAASDLAELVEKPYEQVRGLLAELASADNRILRHVPPPAGEGKPADRYELYHDVLAPAILEWRRQALEQRKYAEDVRERERLEREKREAEERTREQERRRRAFQRLAIGALALLVIAVALGIFALVEQKHAVSNLEAARSSQLVATATQERSRDPELSTLLALRALQTKYTPQAETALRETLPGLQELKTLHVGFPVNAAAFNPAGTQLLTASEDGKVRIWEVADGRQVNMTNDDAGAVNAAAFNSAGSEIAIATKGGTASLWNPASGRKLVLERHAEPILDAAFSPDGAEVVTASEDGSASIWDTQTGRRLRVLRPPGPRWSMGGAAFSPDGREIVTASESGTATIWNAQTGQRLEMMKAPEGGLFNATYSPEGREILTAGADGAARIWNALTGRQVSVLTVPEGPVLDAAFGPDGTQVVSANQEGTATVWSVAGARPLVALDGDEGPVRAAAFSPDGKEIVTASEDGTARIWDASPRERLAVLPIGRPGAVDGVAFSPNHREVVTANQDDTASIFDVVGSKLPLTLSGDEGPIYTAVFSPDGRRVVTASTDGTARIWDAETGEHLHLLRDHAGTVNSAAFSPDGKQVVTADKGGTARIWDAETGEQLRVLRDHAGAVESAAFSPDGKRVVAANENGTVSIWELAGDRQLPALKVSEVAVLYVAFNADGTELLTASKDGTASVWNLSARRRLLELPGNKGPIYGAAFSPDGHEIVTASQDGTATIWDAQDGTPLTSMSGHEGILFGAAFSPGGHEIVTASQDGTAALWSTELAAPVHELERIAERLVTHELTARERKDYVPR